MKKIAFLLLLAFNVNAQFETFEKQAKFRKIIINDINNVRKNPMKYKCAYKSFFIEDYKVQGKQLVHDVNLSKECFKYAVKMARSKDFKHDNSYNGNESFTIAVGFIEICGLSDVVYSLIDETYNVDRGGDGHRVHIFGSKSYCANDTKIGVGMWFCYPNGLIIVIRTE